MQVVQIVLLAAMTASIVAGAVVIWRMTPREPAVGPHDRREPLLVRVGASTSAEVSRVLVTPMELPHCRQAQPESE